MEHDKKPSIRVDHFLKFSGIAATGGQAKMLIQGGEVFVNHVLETRRSRKLQAEDVVMLETMTFAVSDFWPAQE